MRSEGKAPYSSILTNKNMDFKTGVFYFFAAMLVFAALRVITAHNPVHSALFLVLAFFTAAALWVLLEAEFLAIALVLVYVGAVMVLFLFLWFRATFPRYRYDQIMRLGWKVFIPLTIVWLVLVGGLMQTQYWPW